MMARDIFQKKQRIAHNTKDNKNHEMQYEESDFLPSLLEIIRSNDLSDLHLNNLEPSVSGTKGTSVKQKTQVNTIPLSSQNHISVPTTKKSRTSNKCPLMDKATRTLKQIKHNIHIPKPKAHLTTLPNSPIEYNSQSSNNNSKSIEKSKKTKIVRKDLKNTSNNMQNKKTEESEIVNDFNKTGNDASDSDDDDDEYEKFVAKNRPQKSKSDKYCKKSQKSTKVTKTNISKSTSSVSDYNMSDQPTSSKSEYTMSGDEAYSSSGSEYKVSDNETSASSESDSNWSDDEKVASSESNHKVRDDETSASSESDFIVSDDEKVESESYSNVSDEETFASSERKNKNCKKSKKRREVLNNRQSTSKRKSASQSVEKKDRKRSSRTLSKSASQESGSDMSDGTSSCYNRSKRIKNKVFDKKQSTKRDNASASIAKKRNSRTLSKSASQESDSDMSDDKSSYYTRSKRMKRHKVMENRQSTSKVESESDMVIDNEEIIVNDDTYDTDSSDLPPPSEIFKGLKSNIYDSQSPEERENLHNQESKFSSSDETYIAQLESNVQFPVLCKTPDNKSVSVNDQPNVLLKEESSLKTSLVDNDQSNSKYLTTKNCCVSLGVKDQPNVLLKEESSLKTSLVDNDQSNSKCLTTNCCVSLVVNDQPNVLLNEESSLKTSLDDPSNSRCFTTKNGSVLNNSRENNFSKSTVVDLTESDNECESSFTIMPKITKISGQIPNESDLHSEESDVELVDVIIHELPEKSKTNCSSKNVSSNSSNDSTIKTVNVDQILPCNNAKPQNTPELQISLNGTNEAAYSTGMCQGYDEKAESKDMTLSQFNLNKDKPESSIVSNAVNTLISSKEVKKESHEDCEIVIDIAPTNSSNQNLPGAQICNNANIKTAMDSKCIKKVTAIDIARTGSITKEQSNQSSIVSNTEDSLISSMNIKKDPCDDCEIVLDIASTNNSNQNLPGVQICNTANVKMERDSKANKEVTRIGVARSCSITKEHSNQSSIVGNTENSLILSKNIKKDPCDDCEIVLDIASTNNSNQNLPGVQIFNNANIQMARDSKAIKEVTPVCVASCSITKEQSNQSSIVSNTEYSLISSKHIKKDPCDDDCEIVLDINSTNNSNQNLPDVQIYNNANIKIERDSKAIKQVTPIGVARNVFNSKEESNQCSIVSNTQDSLLSSKNIKKDPCDDDCEIVLDIDSTNNSKENLPGLLPQICSNIKIEKNSKVFEQVTPIHVANSGPITTEQNKLSQKEQKLHEVESSDFKNLTASCNETSEHLEKEKKTELDSEKIKVLIDRVKREIATYQEIIETEECVQNTFKSLEKRQAEKLMSLKAAIVECLNSAPSISDCNAIKNTVNKLLGSSELTRSPSLKNCSKVLSACDNITSMSDISVQDLKTFSTMNLVPLSSISENDIKPSLSELQCALKQQASTSVRRNSIDRNWSFGQKCMVCAKDATSACQNCCKVFFCSDECGVKYWENGHKNACKYLK